MTNDLEMSELISKSLRHEMNSEERKKLQEHLHQSKQAQQFSSIAQAIQDSIAFAADLGAKGDPSVAPGLSSEAKARLKKSVSVAVNQNHEETAENKSGNSSTAEVQKTYIPQEAGVEEVPPLRQLSSRFKLIRKLGEGGLGTVWLARDEKLKRNVALKELKQEALEQPRLWKRFHREAEITGQLEHPNVVPLYQFGEDRRTGEPFYAMRFVGKRTLADAIEEHRDRIEAGEDQSLGLHRLLTAFLGVCQAIAYAHSRGVIHRDLKPENVALDNFGQVIVLDWGLAKLKEDGEHANHVTCNLSLTDSALMHTMEGDAVGTPLFMAPEQASGDLDKIDERTDVFGLGAILFAILTGKAPHTDSIDRADAGNLGDVLSIIAESQPPLAQELDSTVPTGLSRICSKAMAFKRHLRFDSVDQLAESVERWMAGQSEKKTNYENIRMEGREHRASLQSAVDDLQRNARFMSRLPPTQHMIGAKTEEDVNLWRERLAKIFQGLLEANEGYRNVAYCAIRDGKLEEIVRVEKHGAEGGRTRVVPKSRLRTVELNCYIELLAKQKPDDVITSLVGDPMCEHTGQCGPVGLVSGVPIFDEATEDIFGVVLIDCDILRLLERQLLRPGTAREIIVACDTFHTIMHVRSRSIVEESAGKPISEFAPHFQPAMDVLQNQLEFIDDNDKELYGGRLWLIPNKHGLVYLLK